MRSWSFYRQALDKIPILIPSDGPGHCTWLLRNDKNIISSISVTDIVSDDYLGKWNIELSQNENLKLFSSYSLVRCVIGTLPKSPPKLFTARCSIAF